MLQPRYGLEAAARSGPRVIRTINHLRHRAKQWYVFDAHWFVKEVAGVKMSMKNGRCGAGTQGKWARGFVAGLTSQTVQVPALVRAETHASIGNGQITLDTQVARRFLLLLRLPKRGYSYIVRSQTPIAVWNRACSRIDSSGEGKRNLGRRVCRASSRGCGPLAG